MKPAEYDHPGAGQSSSADAVREISGRRTSGRRKMPAHSTLLARERLGEDRGRVGDQHRTPDRL
jgi:hypothetical protein